MRLERGQCGHRLEGRAGGIDAVESAVERREVVCARGGGRQPGGREALVGDAARVDTRAVRRARGHREDRAVPRVERDDRAAVGLVLLVLVGEADARLECPFGRALQVDVERQADRLAGLRRALEDEPARPVAERVHRPLRQTVASAQVRVVGRLEPGLADHVAGLVALRAELLQLLRRDLGDVADELGRELAVGVAPEIRVDDLDARELVEVLGEVVDRRVAVHGLADDHRGDRVVLAQLDLGDHLRHRHVDDEREAAQLGQPGLVRALVQVLRRDRHGGAGDRRHERAAVAVEDLAALGREPQRAHLVVERGLQVLRPGEHLQRPEAEEEHAEDDESERAENPEPERELRGEAVGLRDPRVGRQEAIRAGARAASQGAAPPSRPPAPCRARAPSA